MSMRSNSAERHAHAEHQRAWESLPWYVNGTLRGQELKAVDRHIASCVTCRTELEFLRGFGVLVHASNDLEVAADRGLRRVLSRIDGVERSRPNPGERSLRLRLANLRSGFLRAPAALRGALVAQAALILLLVSLMAVSSRSLPSGEFETLSDPLVASSEPGTRLKVMFSEQATEAEIRRLLHELGGEIVAGPSPLGVFTLAIPAAEGDLVDATALAAVLATRPIIRFAEPAADQPTGSAR